MTQELRIVLLDDVREDIELIEQELRSAGLTFTSRHVGNSQAFVEALLNFHPTADSLVCKAESRHTIHDEALRYHLHPRHLSGLCGKVVPGTPEEETADRKRAVVRRHGRAVRQMMVNRGWISGTLAIQA